MPNTNPIFRPSAVQLIEMIRKLERRIRVLETSEGIFDINNENTPATLGASQNNYDPGNYDILRLSSSAAYNITGISGGVKGRRLQLFNIGAYAITLSNLSASSTVTNRFNFVNASDFVIPPNGTALLYYDSTQDYWIGGDMSSIYDVVNENTPTQLSADQNNYDIGLYEVLRLSSSSAVTITGISGGVKGRSLRIFNVGSYAITLAYESASSTAANRFKFSNAQWAVIPPNSNIALYYDSTQSRWVGGDKAGSGVVFALIENTNNQALASTITTQIDPGTVITDQYGIYDDANNKILIPFNGVYSIVFRGYFAGEASANGYLRELWQDIRTAAGVLISSEYGTGNQDTAGNPTRLECTTFRQYTAGEYVRFYAVQNSPTAGSINLTKATVAVSRIS